MACNTKNETGSNDPNIEVDLKGVDFMPWKWLRRRELGDSNIEIPNPINRALYSGFKALHTWEPSKTVTDTHHGGIFNFDFSTDGSLLAAACEGHSILLFDPFNGKMINAKNKAHNDCVNCVRFLDSRMFASCSDDQTVALWDARYLKNKLHHLKGHTNWVKNIEYVPEKGLLVTSGFDGNIYTWDINSYSENAIQGNRVFHTSRLMRSKITPDNKKMVISTQTGCIIVIHNLDLSTLADDLRGFKISKVSYFNKKSCRRNRVEVINDWPTGNKAKVVASLQVHPQGWCVLSRNMSNQDVSEWTCIHDIQESDDNDQDTSSTHVTSCSVNSAVDTSTSSSATGNSALRCSSHLSEVQTASTTSFDPENPLPGNSGSSRSSLGNALSMHPNFSQRPSEFGDSRTPDMNRSGNANLHENIRLLGAFSDTSSDSDSEDSLDSLPGIHIVYQANRQHGAAGGGPNQSQSDEQGQGQGQSTSRDTSSNNNITPHNREFVRISRTLNLNAPLDQNDILTLIIQSGERRRVVNLNYRDGIDERPIANGFTPKLNSRDCLLYYTEEPNVGKGFIKELCFNSDGRIICSPFGFGVRLLAFDPCCRELCDCVPSSPVKLYEVSSCMSHANVVVTSKFSNTHCMLVSGCLNGRVAFHQPVL